MAGKIKLSCRAQKWSFTDTDCWETHEVDASLVRMTPDLAQRLARYGVVRLCFGESRKDGHCENGDECTFAHAAPGMRMALRAAVAPGGSDAPFQYGGPFARAQAGGSTGGSLWPSQQGGGLPASGSAAGRAPGAKGTVHLQAGVHWSAPVPVDWLAGGEGFPVRGPLHWCFGDRAAQCFNPGCAFAHVVPEKRGELIARLKRLSASNEPWPDIAATVRMLCASPERARELASRYGHVLRLLSTGGKVYIEFARPQEAERCVAECKCPDECGELRRPQYAIAPINVTAEVSYWPVPEAVPPSPARQSPPVRYLRRPPGSPERLLDPAGADFPPLGGRSSPAPRSPQAAAPPPPPQEHKQQQRPTPLAAAEQRQRPAAQPSRGPADGGPEEFPNSAATQRREQGPPEAEAPPAPQRGRAEAAPEEDQSAASAGADAELRIDEADGCAYTFEEFVQEYGAGAAARWARSRVAASAPVQEPASPAGLSSSGPLGSSGATPASVSPVQQRAPSPSPPAPHRPGASWQAELKRHLLDEGVPPARAGELIEAFDVGLGVTQRDDVVSLFRPGPDCSRKYMTEADERELNAGLADLNYSKVRLMEKLKLHRFC
eukprot:TRINITY_DN8043_c0_g1_i1.p1 TRINITY_DN8043_c0_g1~~TRINITY_DN8043_c0_g1_i1.p1  ORF type:complete len:635 (+),score=136.48 TRINITY_DN8043_c0_g1_i1:88-1905(+)